VLSSLKHFRDEYQQHLTSAGCPFDPTASMLHPPQLAMMPK